MELFIYTSNVYEICVWIEKKIVFLSPTQKMLYTLLVFKMNTVQIVIWSISKTYYPIWSLDIKDVALAFIISVSANCFGSFFLVLSPISEYKFNVSFINVSSTVSPADFRLIWITKKTHYTKKIKWKGIFNQYDYDELSSAISNILKIIKWIVLLFTLAKSTTFILHIVSINKCT